MKLIDKALSNQLSWVPFGIEFVWLKVADCLIIAVHGGGCECLMLAESFPLEALVFSAI